MWFLCRAWRDDRRCARLLPSGCASRDAVRRMFLGSPSQSAFSMPPSLQTGRYMPQTKFFVALALHAVERAIGSAEKFLNGRSIVGIDRDTDADADRGLLAVVL